MSIDEALKGRHKYCALSGLRPFIYALTQGCALGYHIVAPLGLSQTFSNSFLDTNEGQAKAHQSLGDRRIRLLRPRVAAAD